MKIIKTIIPLCIFFAIWIAILFAIKTFEPPFIFGTSAPLSEIWHQATALIAALVLILIITPLMGDKQMLTPLSVRYGRDIGLSVFVAFFWLATTFCLFVITDSLLDVDSLLFNNLAYWIIAVLLSVITQELVLRGFLYSFVERGYGAGPAIAISAVAGMLLRGGVFEGGVISILFAVAAGVLFGCLRYYTEGLLAPILVHFLWNLVGGLIFGCIILGDGYPTLYSENMTGLEVITGGERGFEGSALSLIVVLLIIDLVAIMIRDANENKEEM